MINEATEYKFAFPKIKSQLDNSYNNVIRFSNDTEALNYFQITDSDFFGGNGNYAYNFAWQDSLHAKDILVDVDTIISVNPVTIAQVLNYNYIVVKEILANNQVKYYYFFITRSKQENYKTIKFSLELDIFTTYKINSDFEIDGAVAERLHRNRWKVYAKESFNTRFYIEAISDKDSIQNSHDDIEVDYPKYLKNVTEITNDDHIDGIAGWLVIITSPIKDYYWKSAKMPKSQALYAPNIDICMPYSVLFAPILEDDPNDPNGIIMMYADAYDTQGTGLHQESEWDASKLIKDFKAGMAQNGTFPFIPPMFHDLSSFSVYSIQVVKNCPLKDIKNYITREANPRYAHFDAIAYENSGGGRSLRQFFMYGTSEETGNVVLPLLGMLPLISFKYDVNVANVFNNVNPFKDDVSAPLQQYDFEDNNMRYEPRLFKKSFTECRLKNLMTESYSFDLFDINFRGRDNIFSLIETEIIHPEGIQCFDTIKSYTPDSEFDKYNYTEMLGLNYILDYSIPVVNNAYLDYIMQNKNYKITGFLLPAASGAANAAFSYAAGRYDKTASAVVGAATTIVNNALSLDDLKNKPDTIKSAKANSLLNFSVYNQDFTSRKMTIQDRIELWQVRPQVLKEVYDYYRLYGYKVNKIVNSSDWFNRVIYNYVKMSDTIIHKIKIINNSKEMSIDVKNKISQALQNGITFWENTTQIFNYTPENWEKNVMNGVIE